MQQPTHFVLDNRCRNISRKKKKKEKKDWKLKSPQTQPCQAIKVLPMEKLGKKQWEEEKMLKIKS